MPETICVRMTFQSFLLGRSSREKTDSLRALQLLIAGNSFVLFLAPELPLGWEDIERSPGELPRHLVFETRLLWRSRSILRWRAISRDGKTLIGIMKRAI